MDDAEDSLMSDSPPSAGDDGSDYEAPTRLKYAIQKRGRLRSQPRVVLRSRRRHPSETSFRPDDDESEDLECHALPDLAPDDLDLDDACSLPVPEVTLPPHQFRSSGRRDRPGRTHIDHDVFEGLPIRQWKQVDAPVGPPPVIVPVTAKNSPWPELPMPRDWQMLPEVSQQLLRAARAGRLYKPPTPPNDEEEERGDDDAADAPVKEAPKGFLTRKWSQIPRHLELPEKEYLAKRRKGLSSVYAGGAASQEVPSVPAPAARTAKVEGLDADGNAVIYEVQAVEGQPVEGEIVEKTVATETAPVLDTVAPATAIEDVSVVDAEGLVVPGTDSGQPTPPRRKPPPPRRKKKGTGKGHKKVMVTGPGMEGVVSAAVAFGADGLPITPSTLADGTTPVDGDTTMHDTGEDESGEAGDEGDESEEEEGSEDGELAETPGLQPGLPLQPPPPAAPTSQPLPGLLATSTLPPLDAVSGPPPSTAVEPAAAPLSPPGTETAKVPPEALLSPIHAGPPPLDPIDTSAASEEHVKPQPNGASATSQGQQAPFEEPAPQAPPPSAVPVEEPPKSATKSDLLGSLERHLDGQESAQLKQPQATETSETAAAPEQPEVVGEPGGGEGPKPTE